MSDGAIREAVGRDAVRHEILDALAALPIRQPPDRILPADEQAVRNFIAASLAR